MLRVLQILYLASVSYLALCAEYPAFENYPSELGNQSKLASEVDISNADVRKYRTALRSAIKEKPNFAGHFTVAKWGCGSACISWAIINRENGKVWLSPFTVSSPACTEHPEYCGPEINFRESSELLIIVGARNEEGAGRYYYRWHNNELQLLTAEESKQ